MTDPTATDKRLPVTSNPVDFRSGFVAIIGKPNTGKSTLMNRLVGDKLSITSPKPQTTRYAIKGILNDENSQVIFVDTPGYLKPRYEMQQKMLDNITQTLKNVDLIMFITEIGTFPTEYDTEVLDLLKGIKTPQIAVFNKIDRTQGYDRNLIHMHLPHSIEEIIFISALYGDNITELVNMIKWHIPYHEPYYDADQLSDLPMRFFAQETIREAIFHYYEQEIPYATAVIVERYQELEDRSVIDATIWIERQSQKPIIIGKNGDNLKRIREYAEAALTQFTGMPVQIHLWIKIKDKWRKHSQALKELGFH